MKPGSAIINTASVNSDCAIPCYLPMATTKGAIQNFTGGLAQTPRVREGHPRQCRRPWSDLDAADSF